MLCGRINPSKKTRHASAEGYEPGPRRAPRRRRGAQASEFLSFRLGADEYGIEILKVQEIRGYGPPTAAALGAPKAK